MEQERNWHYMSAEEVERAFATGAEGLSEAEAARRNRTGRNRIWHIRGDLVAKYAKRSLLDPSAVLLLLSVLAASFYGEGAVAACVIILMLLAKTIEILAFTAADSEFRKNLETSVPRAKVVREGNVKSIPAEMIAEGDVIILDAGDTVPCDIRLTAADGVLVSENLPGHVGLYIKNADPISRHVTDVPIGMRSNMLYATTTVVYGFCMGVAVATGKRTLRVQLGGPVELSGDRDVPLLEKLSELSRMCRLFLVSAAFLFIILSLIFSRGLISAFLPAVAMASACMSEFLAAYGAFAIAMSLRGHRKKDTGINEKTVFKVAARMEEAAHSKVIALRSPALLKCGKLSLHSFYIGGKSVDTKEGAGALPMYACYAAGIGYDGVGGEEFDYLPASYLKSICREYAEERPPYMICEHKNAGEEGSEGLYSSLLLRDGEFVFTCAGEPEAVLERCTRARVEDKEESLSKDARETHLAYAKRLMSQGTKVLAVAKRPSVYNSFRRLPVLLSDLCFEGFIAITEKVETGAVQMISDHRAAGGSVVIFSEGGEEDLLFAKSCDVFRVGDIYMSESESASASTLPVPDGSLIMIATPAGAGGTERRYKFLSMLSEKMKTSYIGCGAEDAAPMQAASVSFAAESYSKPGSGIPQSLRTIADGVVESRGGGFVGAYRMISRFKGVLGGIRSTLRYLIASHVARAFLLLICMVLGIAMPNASVMVFLGLVFDLVCAMASAASDTGESKRIGVRAIPATFEEFIVPTVCGTLVAALSVASPFICKAVMNASGLECTFTDESLFGCIFVGFMAALTYAYADTTSSRGLFARDTKIGKMKLTAPITALVMTVLCFTVEGVGFAMGVTFPGLVPLAVSALPLLAVAIFLAAARVYFKNKVKK